MSYGVQQGLTRDDHVEIIHHAQENEVSSKVTWERRSGNLRDTFQKHPLHKARMSSGDDGRKHKTYAYDTPCWMSRSRGLTSVWQGLAGNEEATMDSRHVRETQRRSKNT